MAQETASIEVIPISGCENIDKSMAQFVMNERFSDINFLVGDKKICAHKVVLAARSDYFDSMLSDSKEMRIDAPLRAFEEVLKYIYLGTVSVPSDEEMIIEILTLANKFSLASLETSVTETLSALMNSLGVCQILNTANLYNLQKLREKCLTFLDQNIAEVLKNDTLCSLSQESMVRLLERDDFPLPEIEVFKLVERWCKVNTDKNNLVKNCVRLTCLTEIEILKTVWPSKLIEETKILVALSQLKDDDFRNDQHRKCQSLSTTTKVTIVIPKVLKNLGLSEDDLGARLNSALTVRLESAIKVENVCSILNAANSYALVDLTEICHKFMDSKFTEVFSSGDFQQLTKQSLIGFLRRDFCAVPEIELFRSAEKWCKDNNNFNEGVFECIRFSSMSLEEIVSIVWPSNLLQPEELRKFILEIIGLQTKSLKERAYLMLNENVASSNRGAQLVAGENTNYLLTGKIVNNCFAYHNIQNDANIIVKLDRPYCLNHISMQLYDLDKRSFSYFIEVSLDGQRWVKVIDYSSFSCRSYQSLYFHEEIAQFIKIVGTKTSAGNKFQLVSFEAFLKNYIPTTINGIIRPKSNVATLQHRALCIEGYAPENILSSNSSSYTYHYFGKGCIVIQLAQPYLISSVKLYLPRDCKYRIKTSINQTKWEVAIDKTDNFYGLWQEDTFSERPVIFIRIVGVASNDSNIDTFHCSGFECTSKNSLQS